MANTYTQALVNEVLISHFHNTLDEDQDDDDVEGPSEANQDFDDDEEDHNPLSGQGRASREASSDPPINSPHRSEPPPPASREASSDPPADSPHRSEPPPAAVKDKGPPPFDKQTKLQAIKQVKKGACLGCGQTGHQIKDCPKKKKTQKPQGRPPVQIHEISGNSDIEIHHLAHSSCTNCTFSTKVFGKHDLLRFPGKINGHDVTVLLDNGSSHNFVDAKLDGRPIAFESKKLSDAEMRYPTYEKELYTVVHALRKWRHYLYGSTFVAWTDHHSLCYICDQGDLRGRKTRWVELMQEFDFEIRYRKGSSNRVANALSRILETKLSMSSSDHPESDGQTERMNQTLEDMLKAYVSHRLSDWERYLPQLEFAYNSSKHSAIEFSSFMLMYGFEPKSPIAIGLEKVKEHQTRDFFYDMQEMLKLAKNSIRKDRDRVTTYANQKRSPRTLDVGQWDLSEDTQGFQDYANKKAL
ncbi:hypothetical protein L7F22_011066 [Adiantum nelumboides]|nr:hypothetical protein [Adiantum nelumboides]